MRIGVPREVKNHEYRVALTPAGAKELTRHGHHVVVERGAGLGSSITDADFEAAGARILPTADEVWAAADLLLKVKEPIESEYHRLRRDQVLFTSGELSEDAVAAVLSPRTRLVAVTAASNLIGTRPPVRAIADLAHEVGALVHVDGVHYTAHAAVHAETLGADFFVCSPYKFLGPHCGVLAADPALLEMLAPQKLAPSSNAVPERFELGTLPYELLAGTTAAVDFLAGIAGSGTSRRDRIVTSMSAVEAYEDRLRTRIEHALADLPVTVYSRAAHRTPTLLVDFPERSSAQAYAFLAERGVNAPASSFYALEASRWLGLGDTGALRIGLAPYVDDSDVDRLLAGLTEFCAV